MNNKKHVNFHDKVKIQYIFTKEELQEYRDALWWNSNDFVYFQMDAIYDVRRVCATRGRMNYNQAMRILYPVEIVPAVETLAEIYPFGNFRDVYSDSDSDSESEFEIIETMKYIIRKIEQI